jgi:hypothetical protein
MKVKVKKKKKIMMMKMNQVMMVGNLNVDHHQKRNQSKKNTKKFQIKFLKIFYSDQIVVDQNLNPMMMILVCF